MTQCSIRWSTSPIDESNFAAATPFATVPDPLAPGQAQSYVALGLQWRWRRKAADRHEWDESFGLVALEAALGDVRGELGQAGLQPHAFFLQLNFLR